MQVVNQFSHPCIHKDENVYAHAVDGVGVITLRTPYLKQGNPINRAVLDGVWHGLEAAMRAGMEGILLTAYSPKPSTPELEKLAKEDGRVLANRRVTSMGANVLEFASEHDLNGPAGLAGLERLLRQGQELSETLYTLAKPVVAAVNGYVLGGGSELFIVPSDYVLATPNLAAGQPEKNLGILPGWGGHKLVHKLGVQNTEELITTGKQVGIEDALRMGYVNEMVALPDELITRGIRKVKELADAGKKPKPTVFEVPGAQYEAKIAGIPDCTCSPACGEKAIRTGFYDILFKPAETGTLTNGQLHDREATVIAGLLRQEGPRNRMLTFVNSMGKRFSTDALRHWHKERVE